jgi:hypothetical protein
LEVIPVPVAALPLLLPLPLVLAVVEALVLPAVAAPVVVRVAVPVVFTPAVVVTVAGRAKFAFSEAAPIAPAGLEPLLVAATPLRATEADEPAAEVAVPAALIVALAFTGAPMTGVSDNAQAARARDQDAGLMLLCWIFIGVFGFWKGPRSRAGPFRMRHAGLIEN